MRGFPGNHPMGPLTPCPLSPSVLTLCTRGSFEFGEVEHTPSGLSSCSSLQGKDRLPEMQVRAGCHLVCVRVGVCVCVCVCVCAHCCVILTHTCVRAYMHVCACAHV